MQGTYKITSIKFGGTCSNRGENKTDEYSKIRIGKMIRIDETNEPKVGQCAYLPYVSGPKGRVLIWNAMITSYITKIDDKDTMVILETQNSIYEFEKMEEQEWCCMRL